MLKTLLGWVPSWVWASGAIAVTAGAWLHGYSVRADIARTASLQSALAVAQQDLAITQQAAQRDRDAAERLTAETEAANARIAEYERTLAGRDACALSVDDVDRLRQLGGPR